MYAECQLVKYVKPRNEGLTILQLCPFHGILALSLCSNILHHLKIVLIMHVQQQKVQYTFIFCAFSWSKMVKCNKSEIINIDDFQDPS